MRTRAKTLTVAAAMVASFAILPSFGAAAAEPLEDGSYEVAIGEATYGVDVVDGVPVVEDVDGVAFTFDFDEDGRVLDEFDVAVDGTTYEVEVGDDGTVTVTDDGEGDDTTESDDDTTESDDDTTESGEDDGEADDEGDDDDDGGDDDTTEALEDGDDEDEGDEEAGEHGELVSAVAQCAPRGRQAREADLPSHGFFVSAAARGEDVAFETDGESHEADLSTPEGIEAFCALTDELLTAAEDGEDLDVPSSTDGDEEDDDGAVRGKGQANGHATAPGQLKKKDD